MVALTLPPSLTFGWARGQDRKSFFRAKKGGEEEQGLPGEVFFAFSLSPKGNSGAREEVLPPPLPSPRRKVLKLSLMHQHQRCGVGYVKREHSLLPSMHATRDATEGLSLQESTVLDRLSHFHRCIYVQFNTEVRWKVSDWSLNWGSSSLPLASRFMLPVPPFVPPTLLNEPRPVQCTLYVPVHPPLEERRGQPRGEGAALNLPLKGTKIAPGGGRLFSFPFLTESLSKKGKEKKNFSRHRSGGEREGRRGAEVSRYPLPRLWVRKGAPDLVQYLALSPLNRQGAFGRELFSSSPTSH